MSKQKKDTGTRNYWAMTFEGSTFIGGIAVMSTAGSVALFINLMTGSKTLVGLAVTIQSLLQLIGQLIVAPYVRSIRNLPKYLTKIVLAQRVLPILISIPLFIGVSNHWSVTIYFILISIFWFFDGLVMLPWSEFCARAIQAEKRGQMMGLQITVGGIVSLLTGLLLTWLLATPVLTDNHRFAFVFLLAGIVFSSSAIFLPMFRDPAPIKNPQKEPMGVYYKRVPTVVKNSKSLQGVLFARIPAYFAFSSATFIVVFGVSALSLSSIQTSWLVYANIVGNLIGGVLLGEISRRLGSKAIILLCNLGVIIALGMAISLALFPTLGYAWLFATCALASMMQSNWLGYHTYFLDISPAHERSVFQVVGNSIGIPFSLVGYLIGAIVDRWGFVSAFALGVTAGVLAVILGTRLQSKRAIQAFIEQQQQET